MGEFSLKQIKVFFKSAAITCGCFLIVFWLVFGMMLSDNRISAVNGQPENYSYEFDSDHNILYMTVFGESLEITLPDADDIAAAANTVRSLMPPDADGAVSLLFEWGEKIYEYLLEKIKVV